MTNDERILKSEFGTNPHIGLARGRNSALHKEAFAFRSGHVTEIFCVPVAHASTLSPLPRSHAPTLLRSCAPAWRVMLGAVAGAGEQDHRPGQDPAKAGQRFRVHGRAG